MRQSFLSEEQKTSNLVPGTPQTPYTPLISRNLSGSLISYSHSPLQPHTPLISSNNSRIQGRMGVTMGESNNRPKSPLSVRGQENTTVEQISIPRSIASMRRQSQLAKRRLSKLVEAAKMDNTGNNIGNNIEIENIENNTVKDPPRLELLQSGEFVPQTKSVEKRSKKDRAALKREKSLARFMEESGVVKAVEEMKELNRRVSSTRRLNNEQQSPSTSKTAITPERSRTPGLLGEKGAFPYPSFLPHSKSKTPSNHLLTPGEQANTKRRNSYMACRLDMPLPLPLPIPPQSFDKDSRKSSSDKSSRKNSLTSRATEESANIIPPLQVSPLRKASNVRRVTMGPMISHEIKTLFQPKINIINHINNSENTAPDVVR